MRATEHKSSINYKLYLVCLLGLFACKQPSNLNNPIELDQEALSFSKGVIKLYFEKDCDAYYDLLSPELFALDGDGIITKEQLEERHCSNIRKAVKDDEKSFEDYLKEFKTEVIDIPTLEEKHNMKLPDYYVPDPSDFIFTGSQPKGQLKDMYIWDDMYLFLVRKEKGSWVIKGGI